MNKKIIQTIATAGAVLSLATLQAQAQTTVHFSSSGAGTTISYSTGLISQRPHSGWAGHFYNTLQPFGVWMQDPRLGWVWIPADALQCPGWNPYVDGIAWTQTGARLIWQPRFNWGFTTYRYGTWSYIDMHGWVWVPGSVTLVAIPQPVVTIRHEYVPSHRREPHYNNRPRHHEETRNPEPVRPTRRSERVQSVAQSRATASAKQETTRSTSGSTRAGRTITVLRSKR